jgi:hypothetical protein
MSDNSTLPATGDVIATNDVGGVKYQRVKIAVGADGSAADMDSTHPVYVAQNSTWTVQPGNTANTTAWKVDASSVAVPVTDNAGSLTVDNGGTFAVQAAQAGPWNLTNISGTVSLPTGASTETSLAALLATAGATSGAKVITDANGTIQQYLRGLVTQWISSTLTLAARTASAAVTLTRTADTNAYAANDVIGAATGSTAALTFANMGPSGGEVTLTSVSLEIDASAVIAGETSYRLYLYNVTPPSALGDNAAFDLPSGDRASFLGYVDLGTPIDLGSTLYVQADNIGKQIKLSGTSLFGYLVTIGAYTPTSARVHIITLHTVY